MREGLADAGHRRRRIPPFYRAVVAQLTRSSAIQCNLLVTASSQHAPAAILKRTESGTAGQPARGRRTLGVAKRRGYRRVYQLRPQWQPRAVRNSPVYG